MADREKVIRGLERCLKHTCPAIDSKEYRDCEYTIGLYCGQDKLMRDALALLKEQEAVVRCKDCRHYNIIGCAGGFGWCERYDVGHTDEWFCADGKKGKK